MLVFPAADSPVIQKTRPGADALLGLFETGSERLSLSSILRHRFRFRYEFSTFATGNDCG